MLFTIATAVFALSSAVFAQTPGFDPISKPTKDEQVPAGSTYLIDWEPSTNWTGTVTIDLLGGPDFKSLESIASIAKNVDSAAGQYSWAVDKTIGKLATYGLRITLDSDATIFQYSFPFTIKATAATNSSLSSSSSASSASESSKTLSSTKTTVTTGANPTITSAPTGGNLSTTAVTRTTSASRTSSTGASVPSNPAVIVGASSVALFGGLVLAIVAL